MDPDLGQDIRGKFKFRASQTQAINKTWCYELMNSLVFYNSARTFINKKDQPKFPLPNTEGPEVYF